jgi:hypothetical protein
MSGDDIPYQLRPNKFIDRQMFLELMSRLIAGRAPENYIYVSMGGRHLVDHHAIYNKLGIQALFSFDMDGNAIARQKFNKPTSKTICVEMNSADLPTQIDNIFAQFPGKRSLVVWLDYTSANRRSQFQDAIQTLVRMKHGDIFRITLNADIRSLGKGNEWKEKGANSPAEYRYEKLRSQIAEFLPTEVSEIRESNFPTVLSRSFGLAAAAAQSQNPALEITPVLITSYSDGTRMLTITCCVRDIKADRFPSEQFRRWKFAAQDWADVRMIYAPVLSPREQYFLDTKINRSAKRILSTLKFLPETDEPASLKALESYRLFHRYYPSFRPVDD